MRQEWVSPKELANRLRVHAETVRRWLRENRLEAMRPGRFWFIRMENGKPVWIRKR